MMSIKDVQSIILPLLRKHRGEIPIASLLYCLDAELGVSLTRNDHGVALEHLVSAVPGVEIKYNDYGIKILAWHDEHAAAGGDGKSSLTRESTWTLHNIINIIPFDRHQQFTQNEPQSFAWRSGRNHLERSHRVGENVLKVNDDVLQIHSDVSQSFW